MTGYQSKKHMAQAIDKVDWADHEPDGLAQPEQEPVQFEAWLAKQHGDPEEIGFLQALRIAYIAGQDSITTPPQRKPLTINEVEQILAQHNYEIHGDRARYIVRMTEAAYGIKE